jgi:hypothetical protein
MLYQIQLKPLLAVLLSSGLMSAVNIQIPKNLQARDLLVFGAEARAWDGNASQSQRNKFQNNRQGRSTNASRNQPVRTRSQQTSPSSGNKLAQTRSHPNRITNAGRSQAVRTRSNPTQTSQLRKNKPAPTRSRSFRNSPVPYYRNAPRSSSTSNRTQNSSSILTPNISKPNSPPYRPQLAPNRPQTELAPLHLPKTPNLYQQRKRKTVAYPFLDKPKIQNSFDLIELPTTIETLPLESPEIYYPVNSADRSLKTTSTNSFLAGFTKLVQSLAVSLLGVPIWILWSKLKKDRIPSSSDG